MIVFEILQIGNSAEEGTGFRRSGISGKNKWFACVVSISARN